MVERILRGVAGGLILLSLLLALFVDAKAQEKAALVCENEGYKVIRARIG